MYTQHQSTRSGFIGGVAGPLQPLLTLLGRLLKIGEVVELRLFATPDAKDCFGNGYFNDAVRLAETVRQWEGQVGAIAFSVNPVRRSLLSAAENQIRRPPGWMADVGDITRRCVLPVSFQYAAHLDRPLVFDLALQCHTWLKNQRWADPVMAEDARGIQLLYAVDLPNDAASAALTNQILVAIGNRFNTQAVHIDTTASRADVIRPLYGALTYPIHPATDLRPNPPQILNLPDTLDIVPREALEAIAWLSVAVSSRPEAPLEAVAVNAIRHFVSEHCSLDPDAWTPTGILYHCYQIFCYEHRLDPLSPSHFARNLIAHWNLTPDRRKLRGVVTRGLWGIQLHHSQSDGGRPA